METKAKVLGEIVVHKEYVSANMLDAYTTLLPIYGTEFKKKIKNYRKDKDYYYFPRNLLKFRKYCDNLFEYEVVRGREVLFDMIYPPLPHQVSPIDKIISLFKSNLNILFKAETRYGKTYSLVNIISHLKTNTLILVDKVLLVDQFISDTKNYSNAKVGKLTKEYDNTLDIYVCTFQFFHANLALLERVKNDFGFIAVDECHSLTANSYRRILYKFNSRYRLGMSATPTAKQRELTSLITDSFGKVKVIGKYEGIQVAVYQYTLPYHYQFDPARLPAEQIVEYFLNPKVVEHITALLENIKQRKVKVLLATGSKELQNFYYKIAIDLGFTPAIMNSEAKNVKRKDENFIKFKNNELDMFIGLNQLMKGVSAPIEIIVDMFAVGTEENVEQLVGRVRTPFEGRKDASIIQLLSKFKTSKNRKVEQFLKALNFTDFKGDWNETRTN